MAHGAREIRRRIASIQSTQQITKAMEMVAAARLRRSQGRVLSARPFADKLHAVLARAVAAVDASRYRHPLLEAPEPHRPPLYVVITADRGLAGPYNANVIRYAVNLREQHPEMGVVVVGRRGRDAFQRLGWELEGVFLHLGDEGPLQRGAGDRPAGEPGLHGRPVRLGPPGLQRFLSTRSPTRRWR